MKKIAANKKDPRPGNSLHALVVPPISLMPIAVAPSFSLGSLNHNLCHAECSTSYGIMTALTKPCLDGQTALGFSGMRCKNSLFGSTQFHWMHIGRNLCLSRVSVAADYSDSVPDSSNFKNYHGFHPLEDLKACKRVRVTSLTSAEIARTTVEGCSSALLVFPGIIHNEPHQQISWAKFPYVIDDYGDMIFEISNDENIMEDRGGRNPVNVFIGMDMPIFEKHKIIIGEADPSDIDPSEMPNGDSIIEDMETEDCDIPVDWGMPDPSRLVHPIYFAKCLSMVVNKEYDKEMDYPCNGVSIFGCLRPVFPDDEFYLRRLFHGEVDEDVYDLDWKDSDFSSSSSKRQGVSFGSTLHRLDIFKIELFSVYGVQSEISLDDYLDAEPDVLVHSTKAIVERFTKKGIRCSVALKGFCKKKGLHVEEANLIGVDSLGMDVRVHSGIEVKTHRFPFKIRARSEAAAEKQIQQLLFPRSRRKKLKTHGDGYSKPDSY